MADDVKDGLEEGVEELTKAEPSAPRKRSSLKDVLDEIGAEEAVARLELRVQGLEGEIERADRRMHEWERARRGELDVMRARIEDVLTAVDSSLDDQRGAAKELEARVVGQIAEASGIARGELHELRDTLTPKVAQATQEFESQVSKLRGEIGRVDTAGTSRLEDAKGQLAKIREEIETVSEDLRRDVSASGDNSKKQLAEFRAELASRVEVVETASEARQQDASDRLEALRRELDAATGELRAQVHLRANELKGDLQSLKSELGEAADVGQERDDDLERRWIDATKDVAGRIDQAVSRVEQEVRKEREERQTTVARAEQRLDEAMGRIDNLGDKVDATKRPQVEDVRQNISAIESKVESLSSQVTSAVSTIASDLTNRVAVVGGDVDAVRATTKDHTEELAKLGGLSATLESVRQEMQAAVSGLRDEIKQLRQVPPATVTDEGALEASREAQRAAEAAGAQNREVITVVTAMQEELRSLAGLRQEVRDQSSRLVEAVARAESAEQAALQTREAVAAAVRRGREARAVSRPSTNDE